jgi:hypothetical protein
MYDWTLNILHINKLLFHGSPPGHKQVWNVHIQLPAAQTQYDVRYVYKFLLILFMVRKDAILHETS